MNSKITSFWEKFPLYLLSFLTFMLPLIFVSFQKLDFVSTKVGFMVIVFSLILFVWSINALKSNKFKLPTNLLSLSIILIPITYLLSAIFSGNMDISILGKDFGYDSFLILSILFVFLLFVSRNFQDEKKAVNLKLVIFSSISILLLFHIFRILLGGFFPSFNFFFESTSNTVGQWFDLGIVSGLGAILSIISIELFELNKRLRYFLFGLLSLSLLSMIMVGFTTVWIILGIFSIIVFVYVFSLNKMKESEMKLPVTSLVTFLLAFVFLIGGGQINSVVNQVFQISPNEIVPPSLESTTEVLKGTLKNDPIFGVGPTNFDQAWSQYKPTSFNQSDLWSINFRYGHSLILSYIVMGGLLSLLAWGLFFVLYIKYGFKALFMKNTSDISRYISVSSFISSLYMWIMTLVYVPSFVNLFLTFTLTGIFIASMYRENLLKVTEFDITKNSKYGFLYIFSIVILLLVVTTSIWHFSVRTISQSSYREGQISLNQGDVNQAELKLFNSLVFYPTDIKIQQLTEIGLFRLEEIINNPELSEDDRVASFRNLLSGVISNLRLAISYDPTNSTNYVLSGQLFERLVTYGIEGSYTESKASYERARELDPKNPAIVLSLARLEVRNNDFDAARELISSALELKNNYSAAVFLLSQIEVAEGNIEQAIRTVETAVQIRPNDPLIFFQLGLLRYEDERYESAVSAFENALVLNTNYDNALYFLGLSYEQVDRTEDAITVFNLLSQKYPENESVQTILSNLNSGAPVVETIVVEEDEIEELPIEETIEE